MSAEGKKKRGISGLSNAKNIAFRYGGSKCDYSTARRNVTTGPRLAGSLTVRAFVLAEMLVRMGKVQPFTVPYTTQVKVERAMERCTHPLLKGEDIKLAAE